MGTEAHFVTRLVGTLVVAGLAFAGCATDKATPKAGTDPFSEDSGVKIPRNATSTFDAGPAPEGSYCSTLVAAECDGNEDCGPGQTCCGTVDGGAALRYNSIKCQDVCDPAAGGRFLCHLGEKCPGESDGGAPDGAVDVTCGRSLILPQYLAVCVTPNPLLPNVVTQPSSAAHAVSCGETLVCGPGTKCCVLGNWDAATRTVTTRTGYCAAVDEECDCTKAPPSDGG